MAQELVEKSGSWFSFGGERIGQGRENARTFLMEHPEICDRLDAELRRQLGLGASGDVEVSAAAASGD